MPTHVIVTKQVLQISDYFKNFNCIVETVKENQSLTKQSKNGNHFNLDSNSIRIDNVYFCWYCKYKYWNKLHLRGENLWKSTICWKLMNHIANSAHCSSYAFLWHHANVGKATMCKEPIWNLSEMVGVHPTLTRLSKFFHHDEIYARKLPLPLCV
jgi:hypothetical protein